MAVGMHCRRLAAGSAWILNLVFFIFYRRLCHYSLPGAVSTAELGVLGYRQHLDVYFEYSMHLMETYLLDMT